MAATQEVIGTQKSSRPETMTIRLLTLLLIVFLPRNYPVTQLQVKKKKVSECAIAALSLLLRENENRELISPPPQAGNK